MINEQENDVLNETVEQINKKDSSLAAELHDYVQAALPDEKARAERELRETGEAKRNLESDYVDGRGQAIGSIPPIIFYRWQQLYPGCWRDKQFVDEFLVDNPQCCLPGYRPKPKTVYFDMGRTPKLTPGAEKYHSLKGRVASDAAEIARRFKLMGFDVASLSN